MPRPRFAPLLSPLACMTTLVLGACATTPAGEAPNAALDRELAAMVADTAHPLLNVSALAIRDGRVVYRGHFGRRHVATATTPDLPVTDRTLFRVASISKLVVAVGVMKLVEEGRLSLDEDVSTWLGWRLRNPHFPDHPITLRLLLSHRSSLTDGSAEAYTFGASTSLRDVLSPDGRHYREGAYWRRDRAPGTWYSYVNFNSGVVATVMERATGERFDRLMQRLVLGPLGLRGGFNPAELPAADQADIATMYRKRREIGGRDVWQPEGPWVVQADDFVSQPPAPLPDLERYEVGSNGTLFGPQGRLRISLDDLGVLMQMLLDEGRHRGVPFLQPATVRLLASEQWRRDKGNAPDGENVGACSWGLGAQRFTDTAGAGCGDRLVEGGGFTGFGHTGDAYGLMGAFVVDRERRRGMIVIACGPGVDPATTFRSRYSALYRWQEIALTAIARRVFPAARDRD